MAVSLSKGGNVSLSKEAPGLKAIDVGLGWDVRATDGTDFDLDASVFILGENGKVRSDSDFIFYNNAKSSDGAVEHTGDNRTGEGEGDDEQVKMNLANMPADVTRLVVAVTIHEGEDAQAELRSGAKRLPCAWSTRTAARKSPATTCPRTTPPRPALIFGEIYRNNEEWKFKAVGQGYSGGLASLAKDHGINLG